MKNALCAFCCLQLLTIASVPAARAQDGPRSGADALAVTRPEIEHPTNPVTTNDATKFVPIPVGARKTSTSKQAAASTYDWSGFYVGGHLGYGWAQADTLIVGLPSPSDIAPATPQPDPRGWTGGGRIQLAIRTLRRWR